MIKLAWFMGWVMLMMVMVEVEVVRGHLKLLVPAVENDQFDNFVAAKCQPPGTIQNCTFSGLTVEVFKKSVQRLSTLTPPISFPSYEFIPFHLGANYDDMLTKLVNKEADGVVADLTILAERMKLVDFTHPYMQSTLEMVVPYRYASAIRSKQLWNFLRPFSIELWICIFVVFISTGIIIFVLEHKNPHFHQEGINLKAQFANIFWFISMTLFFSQKIEVVTRLGRLLMVVWLMVVLIITSSYTASLTSILATKQLTPTMKSFSELLRSNLSIGCHEGSFAQKIIYTYFHLDPTRFIMIDKDVKYTDTLESGLVAAIVDESPYVQTLLNFNCDRYAKVASNIANLGGFGFAFQKNSSITHDISIGILDLEQDGELQRIRDSWVGGENCHLDDTNTQISLDNFGGLFLIVAIFYSACIFVKFLGWFRQTCNCKKQRVKTSSIIDNVVMNALPRDNTSLSADHALP